MKKITLFLAALAVVIYANALSQGGIYYGTYDPVTKVFTESNDDKPGTELNRYCVSYAVQLSNLTPASARGFHLVDSLNNALGYATLAVQGFRIGDYAKFDNSDVRLTLAPDATFDDGTPADHVYYLPSFDLGPGLYNPNTGAPMAFDPLNSTGDLTKLHFHSNYFIAGADVPETDPGYFWYEQSKALGFDFYQYLGEFDPNATVEQCELSAIGDPHADDPDCKVTGYYNMLGQKLADKPGKGAYIETYDNCPAQKFVQ